MSESKAIGVQLTQQQIEQIDRLAQREGRSREAMAARLLELTLRLRDYSFVLRDFGIGPEMFLSGSRLRVWWVATLIRDYEGDIAKTAEHVNELESTIVEVQRYAETYPEEIEADIAANDKSFEDLQRILPNIRLIEVDLSKADAAAP
jgi:hypothetical protein